MEGIAIIGPRPRANPVEHLRAERARRQQLDADVRRTLDRLDRVLRSKPSACGSRGKSPRTASLPSNAYERGGFNCLPVDVSAVRGMPVEHFDAGRIISIR